MRSAFRCWLWGLALLAASTQIVQARPCEGQIFGTLGMGSNLTPWPDSTNNCITISTSDYDCIGYTPTEDEVDQCAVSASGITVTSCTYSSGTNVWTIYYSAPSTPQTFTISLELNDTNHQGYTDDNPFTLNLGGVVVENWWYTTDSPPTAEYAPHVAEIRVAPDTEANQPTWASAGTDTSICTEFDHVWVLVKIHDIDRKQTNSSGNMVDVSGDAGESFVLTMSDQNSPSGAYWDTPVQRVSDASGIYYITKYYPRVAGHQHIHLIIQDESNKGQYDAGQRRDSNVQNANVEFDVYAHPMDARAYRSVQQGAQNTKVSLAYGLVSPFLGSSASDYSTISFALRVSPTTEIDPETLNPVPPLSSVDWSFSGETYFTSAWSWDGGWNSAGSFSSEAVPDVNNTNGARFFDSGASVQYPYLLLTNDYTTSGMMTDDYYASYTSTLAQELYWTCSHCSATGELFGPALSFSGLYGQQNGNNATRLEIHGYNMGNCRYRPESPSPASPSWSQYHLW